MRHTLNAFRSHIHTLTHSQTARELVLRAAVQTQFVGAITKRLKFVRLMAGFSTFLELRPGRTHSVLFLSLLMRNARCVCVFVCERGRERERERGREIKRERERERERKRERERERKRERESDTERERERAREKKGKAKK